MEPKKLRIQQQLYGQLVIGPPGSGKSTYCHKITEFYKQLNRNVAVVNLDPANENMSYKPEVDIMSLITVEDAMENLKLGPNGALMYCMEFLETNFDWLLQKMNESTSNYFIFDCPGEVYDDIRNQIKFNRFCTLQVKLSFTHITNQCATFSRS